MPPPLDPGKQDSQPQEDRITPPAFLDLADSVSILVLRLPLFSH
jgi:hypothetical protein